MSLQNLKQPNNYELYVGNAVIENIETNELSVNLIKADPPNTEIQINNDLVPVASIATSLGSTSLGFRNLFCQNLCGLNAEVNVPNGITGANASTKLNIVAGLQFGAISGSNTQATLNNYLEGTTSLTASGAISANISIKYTVIGKSVCLGMSIPPGTLAVAGGSTPIIFTLPVGLRPLSPVAINGVTMLVNNTKPIGSVLIATSGVVNIFSTDARSTDSYVIGQVANFCVPDNQYTYISYNLV